MVATQETPVIFHCLLEMHRDGRVLAKLELNVPMQAFSEVQFNSIRAFEAMLRECAKPKLELLPEVTKGPP